MIFSGKEKRHAHNNLNALYFVKNFVMTIVITLIAKLINNYSVKSRGISPDT